MIAWLALSPGINILGYFFGVNEPNLTVILIFFALGSLLVTIFTGFAHDIWLLHFQSGDRRTPCLGALKMRCQITRDFVQAFGASSSSMYATRQCRRLRAASGIALYPVCINYRNFLTMRGCASTWVNRCWPIVSQRLDTFVERLGFGSMLGHIVGDQR